jgi:chemotaxis methyl-accepting protein methylase
VSALEYAGQLVAERVGLRLEGTSVGRLRRALESQAARAGVTVDSFVLKLSRGGPEFDDLLDELTVQESSFFRHEPQFEVIAHSAARNGGGVIWSAGCGDGQEPWSLAMLLAERGLDGWSVLATDVSRAALARARTGRYAERQIAGVSQLRRRRFLRAVGGGFEVTDELRARVRFEAHNLVRDVPPPVADGHIVLCRNVLIYLRPEEADALLERLRRHMPPDGLLVIGAAESLRPDHPSFDARREGDVFVLRPKALRPSAPDHVADGERLAAEGDPRGAAGAFRRALDEDPTDPLLHVRLALALEAAGDSAGAHRAFAAARLALADSEREHLERALDGYSVTELERLITERGS